MAALVARGMRRKTERGVVLLGVDLRDAREEIFVRMVCDGLALGVAFSKAGFTSKDHNAPSNLFHLPRVQERAAAILEARRTQGVVTLGEVTSMLQRVFAGAHAAEEYSAAHNAAFSLARLYGHVTDRATLEVIRRPSRDPDAPSEMALGAWVEALPALPGPGPTPDGASFLRLGEAQGPGISARDGAPARPLGPEPTIPSNINGLEAEARGPEGPGPEISNEINWLNRGTTVAGRPENGAPSGPVTGTPNGGGPSGVLGPGAPGVPPSEKGAPMPERQVPGTNTGPESIPSFEELFG